MDCGQRINLEAVVLAPAAGVCLPACLPAVAGFLAFLWGLTS